MPQHPPVSSINQPNECLQSPGRLNETSTCDRDVNSTMFQFKGAVAEDASNKSMERDWRVVDHYNIQQLGKRPFNTMQLPPTSLHQRSWTEHTRPPSLLQIRSRSKSSIASRDIYDRGDRSSHLSINRTLPHNPTGRRSLSGESTHKRAGSSDSLGKTLMAKGAKLLRRQNSKHDLTSLQTLEWLEGSHGKGHFQETSTQPGPRRSRIQASGDDASPRYNISEPFNFQHLTHTTPQHVEKIQSTNHDDLVSEFSAIRASQEPRRELRGIKANDIYVGTSFPQNAASETSSPPRTGYSNSPPGSPAQGQGQVETHSYNLVSPGRKLSHSRSIENFSQPSPSYHTAQSSPSSPLSRQASRSFAPDFFTSHHELTNEPNLFRPTTKEGPEPLDYPIATWNDGIYDSSLPHAVTTPDDTAHSIQPPPFSMVKTELAGVPEEDETSEGKRSSIATSIVRPTTPTSSIRHAKSFPSIKTSPHRRSEAHSHTKEECDEWPPRSTKSVSFAAPPVDEHKEEIPTRPRVSRRISLRKEDSWEDVIDYCYEHEAEADCNFDWELAPIRKKSENLRSESSYKLVNCTRAGSEVPLHWSVDASVTPNHHTMAHSRSSSNYSTSPPLLLPLQTSLPDLQSPNATSAESSFSSIPEAVTPLQSQEPSLPKKASDPNRRGWSGTDAPVLIPDDSESPFDNMYREMLSSHDASDPLLSFHPTRIDGSTISNSPRSSRSPISKSSSQESFWYSQANAAARRQRNAGSVGSLPELTQSRSVEKPENSTEQLADNMVLLNAHDNPADGSQRRCSPNLAKNVALKSIMCKAMTQEEREPLPIHPAFRERASSDATSLSSEYSTTSTAQPKSVGRKRSTSSASSLSSRTGKRASYSLFPSPPVNRS